LRLQPELGEGPVRVGGEVEGDLRLEGVGVLELVDEDPRPARLRPAADVGVVAEQVAGPRQEVVEGGDAALAALGGVFEDEIAKRLQQAVEDLRPPAGEDLLRLFETGAELLPQLVEAAAAPVLLAADLDGLVVE